MDINQASLQMHYDLHGKIEVISRKKIETREDLSLAYTPGVAEPCRVIAKDYEQSFKLTRRSNLVAVITDGTAVLGLGVAVVVVAQILSLTTLAAAVNPAADGATL